MALDGTLKESNVRDSIKKFFVDNIETIEGVPITFDTGLSTPAMQELSVLEWVAIQFGSFDLDNLASVFLEIYCCTKQDPEYSRLALLRDKVMGYLVDTSQTDCLKRIDLYQSHPSSAWTRLTSMIVLLDPEGPQLTAPDGTKFKVINARLKWGGAI